MNSQLNKNQINKISLGKAILIKPKSLYNNNQENKVEFQKKSSYNDFNPDINIHYHKNDVKLNYLQNKKEKNLYYIDEDYYKNLEESLFSHEKKLCKTKSKKKINQKDKKHKKDKVKSHSVQKIGIDDGNNIAKKENDQNKDKEVPQIYINKNNEKEDKRHENKEKIKNMINRVFSIENKQFKVNDDLSNDKTPQFYKQINKDCRKEVMHQESKLNLGKNKEVLFFPSKTDNMLFNSISNNIQGKMNHLDDNNCFNINTLNNCNINSENKVDKCIISDKNNNINNVQSTKKNFENEQFKRNICSKTTQKLIKSNGTIKKNSGIKNIFAKCIPFCITSK